MNDKLQKLISSAQQLGVTKMFAKAVELLPSELVANPAVIAVLRQARAAALNECGTADDQTE